jgi:hypothetical protein
MSLHWREIPQAARKIRERSLESLGPHVIAESTQDAWYHGGTQVVFTRGAGGALVLEVNDFEEGTYIELYLDREKVDALLDLAAGE